MREAEGMPSEPPAYLAVAAELLREIWEGRYVDRRLRWLQRSLTDRAWLEGTFGQDTLSSWHRWTGFASFQLLLAHVVLAIAGRAQRAGTGVVTITGRFDRIGIAARVRDYPASYAPFEQAASARRAPRYLTTVGD